MKKKLALHWQILIGLALGVGFGGVVSIIGDESGAITQFTKDWIKCGCNWAN